VLPGLLLSVLALSGLGGIPLDTTLVQWPAEYPQQTPALASGSSSALAVWEDGRNSDADVYACRVLETGPLDPDGIPVCAVTGAQRAPAAAFDGTNWLVVWHDYRNGSAPDIYGARVDQTGTVLDSLGIAISTAAGDQRYPRVA
jgi:hypothetical protein